MPPLAGRRDDTDSPTGGHVAQPGRRQWSHAPTPLEPNPEESQHILSPPQSGATAHRRGRPGPPAAAAVVVRSILVHDAGHRRARTPPEIEKTRSITRVAVADRPRPFR